MYRLSYENLQGNQEVWDDLSDTQKNIIESMLSKKSHQIWVFY